MIQNDILFTGDINRVIESGCWIVLLIVAVIREGKKQKIILRLLVANRMEKGRGGSYKAMEICMCVFVFSVICLFGNLPFKLFSGN